MQTKNHFGLSAKLLKSGQRMLLLLLSLSLISLSSCGEEGTLDPDTHEHDAHEEAIEDALSHLAEAAQTNIDLPSTFAGPPELHAEHEAVNVVFTTTGYAEVHLDEAGEHELLLLWEDLDVTVAVSNTSSGLVDIEEQGTNDNAPWILFDAASEDVLIFSASSLITNKLVLLEVDSDHDHDHDHD